MLHGLGVLRCELDVLDSMIVLDVVMVAGYMVLLELLCEPLIMLCKLIAQCKSTSCYLLWKLADEDENAVQDEVQG